MESHGKPLWSPGLDGVSLHGAGKALVAGLAARDDGQAELVLARGRADGRIFL